MNLRREAQADVLKAGLTQQREKLFPNQRVAAELRLQRGEFFPDGVEPRALRIKFIGQDVVLLNAPPAAGPQHAAHFAEHPHRVGNVLQQVPTVNDIEARPVERKPVRVASFEAQVWLGDVRGRELLG